MKNETPFSPGQSVSNTPFPFACRGCGKLCCADTDVLVSPPEAACIAWYLKREHILLKNPRWGTLSLGGSTGLPVLKLAFAPWKEAPGAHRYCPFLVPLPGHENAARCGVYPARPAPCRLFPLGRLIRLDDNTESYIVMERCPGFEPPTPGEPLPEDYQPASPGQTRESWARKHANPEQDAEKRLYVEVIQAYMERGLHAPTRDSPTGLLSIESSLFLGQSLFYNLPPAPADPAQDHQTITGWLHFLREARDRVREMLVLPQTRSGLVHEHRN
jgi:Fe-S-cluster containining protein